MAQKSKTYYATRSFVRGLVKVFILLTAYVIIHVAATNIWTAVLFVLVGIGGVAVYDRKQAVQNT